LETIETQYTIIAMLKLLKQYRFYLAILAFLLIPILSIDTANRAPRDFQFYDRAALAVTEPFQIAIHWLLDTTVNVYENYILRGERLPKFPESL